MENKPLFIAAAIILSPTFNSSPTPFPNLLPNVPWSPNLG